MINEVAFDVWDNLKHQKMRFYTEKQSFIDASTKSSFVQFESSERSWKRITDISMNPGILKEKLQPNKVFAGELSSEATVCALTAVVNHDIKFSTDFIGISIHPHNVNSFYLMLLYRMESLYLIILANMVSSYS